MSGRPGPPAMLLLEVRVPSPHLVLGDAAGSHEINDDRLKREEHELLGE